MRRFCTLIAIAALPLAAQSIRSMNQELSVLAASDAPRVRELAKSRLSALAELLPNNPAAAIGAALRPEVLDNLRLITADLESWGSWTGTVQIAIEDDFEGHKSRTHTSIIQPDGERMRVFLATPNASMVTGATVRLEGLQVNDMIAVTSAATVIQPAAASACNTGQQKIVFLLVNFHSSQIDPGATAAYLKGLVTNTTGNSVDGYFREVSGGITSATADVFGPFNLAGDYTLSTSSQLQNAAIAAAASTVTFPNYQHIAIITPEAFFTGNTAGYGTIGCSRQTYAGIGSFIAGVVWLPSHLLASSNGLGITLISHELGHNFGFNHASSESYASEPLGPVATTPTHDEYGDRFSIMGLAYTYGTTTLTGHYAAPHKIAAGWLGTQNYTNVTTSGTYTLVPAESGTSGLQALRIQRGSANQFLWVEYRQSLGYDSSFGLSGFSTQVYTGALIHLEDPTGYSGYTRLLNFSSPATTNFVTPALVAGSTWRDPYTPLSITVNSANSLGMSVTVSYSATSHTPSITSVSPAAGAGASQTYTFQFADTSGYSDLTVVNVLLNNALDGRHACYIAYAQQSNTLFLVDDAGDGAYAGSLVLNGSGSVSNSQCTIQGTGSAASGSGNTLSLTLNMSFSGSFGGNKVLYLAARDTAASNSGWQTMGVRGVPPLPVTFPAAVSMTPASGTTASSVVSFVYQDSSAAGNLQTAWALINTSIDGRSACYVAYYRPGNLLFLYPDSGDGTQAASMLLTGINALSNSQCTISAQGSSVSTSGNVLTVSLNVGFRSSFTGPRAVWMAVATATQTSAWQALGTWRVP